MIKIIFKFDGLVWVFKCYVVSYKQEVSRSSPQANCLCDNVRLTWCPHWIKHQKYTKQIYLKYHPWNKGNAKKISYNLFFKIKIQTIFLLYISRKPQFGCCQAERGRTRGSMLHHLPHLAWCLQVLPPPTIIRKKVQMRLMETSTCSFIMMILDYRVDGQDGLKVTELPSIIVNFIAWGVGA